MIKKVKSGSSGITLIELVTTVAIMLILIGIVVSTTMSDSGFLKEARKANKNEIASEENSQTKINEIKQDTTENIADGATQNVEDKEAPIIDKIQINNITATSFEVKAEVTEKGSGIAKIEYSIDNGKTWYPTNSDTDNAVTYRYTFYKLTTKKKYTVTVKAIDIAGNSSTSTKDVTTK